MICEFDLAYASSILEPLVNVPPMLQVWPPSIDRTMYEALPTALATALFGSLGSKRTSHTCPPE